MKNSKTLLLTILSTITLGVASLGAISSIAKNNDPVEVAEAVSYPQEQHGLYRKITKPSTELQDGDTVIIAHELGYTSDNWWGNPAYCHVTNNNVYLNNDKSLLLLDNAYVSPFTVRIVDGYYSFHATYTRYNTNFGGYLGWDNRGSSSSAPGPNDYTNDNIGIGYFYSYFALRKQNTTQDTHFSLSYNETTGFMTITNRAGHGNLSYTTGYEHRFCYGGDPDLNIYKLHTFGGNIAVASYPTKTNYTQGDKLDLTDLVVDIPAVKPGDFYTISYNDNPQFFGFETYVTGVGSGVQKDVSIRYTGQSFKITINIDSSHGRFYKVTDPIFDGRGSYMFVIDRGDGDYAALSFSYQYQEYRSTLTSVTITDGYITTAGDTTIMNIVYENNNYYIRSQNLSLYVNDPNDNYLVAENSKTTPVTFDYNNGGPLVKHGEKFLSNINYNDIAFSYANPVDIYRLEYVPSEKMVTFMTNFRNLVNKCDYYGQNNFYGTYKTEWDAMESSYLLLDTADQVYLHNVTYTHNAEVRDSYPDLIDRYDYILAKYDAFDFMERKTFGSYEPHYHTAYNPIVNVIIKDSTLSIALIVAVTFVLTGTALFFYLKKRKQRF